MSVMVRAAGLRGLPDLVQEHGGDAAAMLDRFELSPPMLGDTDGLIRARTAGEVLEALAAELLNLGHEVRLLAPYDPDDRLARVMHRGASPRPRPLPDHVIPLDRTVGLLAVGQVPG